MSPETTISQEALSKFDPPLQALMQGRPLPDDRYDVTLGRDGVKKYGVLVDGATADEIRNLGVEVSSQLTSVLVVRGTPQELARVARLSSVRSIHSGNTNVPGR